MTDVSVSILKKFKKAPARFSEDTPPLAWGWSNSQLRNGDINHSWDNHICHVFMDVWCQPNSPSSHAYITASPPSNLCTWMKSERTCDSQIFEKHRLSIWAHCLNQVLEEHFLRRLGNKETGMSYLDYISHNSSFGFHHISARNKFGHLLSKNKGGMSVAQPLSIFVALLCAVLRQLP